MNYFVKTNCEFIICLMLQGRRRQSALMMARLKHMGRKVCLVAGHFVS